MADAIDFTATGGAYYRVKVNGEVVSQHSAKHKALERATELEIEDPTRVVTVELTEEIRVEAPAPVLPAWGAERRSGYERRQADVNNGLRRRVAQRRGAVLQFPPAGSETVGSVAFTTPPDSAMEVAETYQAAVEVLSPLMPDLVDPSAPHQARVLTGRTVVWSTSNAAVATVVAGLVTAEGAGTCDITATCEGVAVSFSLTVTASAATVDSVEVSPAPFSVFEASTQQLVGTPKDASGNAILGLTGSWSSNDTNVATVNASTGLVAGVAAGTCTITYTVDGVPGTSACTVSVAPSGSEFVTFPDTSTARILGPLLVSGSTDNPWAFYDTNQATKAALGGPVVPAADLWPTPATGTGTVTVTNGSPTVTGSGTTFTTEYQVGSWFWARNSADTAWVGQAYVVSVESDTSMTVAAQSGASFVQYWPHPTATGVAHNRNVNSAYTTQLIGYTFYYDTALSFYNLYYRTGNTTYRDYARKAADSWYRNQMNEGNFTGDGGFAPRSAYIPGLMLRALDGRPELWDAIERYASYQFNIWVYIRKDNAQLHQGIRDGAFCTLFIALCAALLPDSYRNTADTANIDGVAKRAYHKARLATVIADYYDRLQYPDGGFYFTDNWTSANGLPRPDGALGTVPFQMGYLQEALIQSHRLFNDAGDTATALLCKNILLGTVDWAYASVRQDQSNVAGVKLRCTWYWMSGDGAYSHLGMGVNGVTGNRWIDDRQLTAMISGAFGYAYVLTGDATYLTQGDDVFSAVFGYNSGPGADGKMGLMADLVVTGYGYYSRLKEYNQSYRSAGRYLAWRAGSTD